MRRVRPMFVLILVAGVLVLAACGDGSSQENAVVAGRELATRTVEVASVKVEVSPLRLDARGATFAVTFDTHEGALGLDPADGARLRVGGVEWTAARWQGDGVGGHHRSGELRFTPGGQVKRPIHLTISGLDRPVTFEWKS